MEQMSNTTRTTNKMIIDRLDAAIIAAIEEFKRIPDPENCAVDRGGWTLAFHNRSQNWAIEYCIGISPDLDDEWIDIMDAPLDIRIKAVDSFHHLLVRLEFEKGDRRKNIEVATSKAHDFANSIIERYPHISTPTEKQLNIIIGE